MSYAVIYNPEDYSYVLKDVELVELNLIDEMKMEFFLNNIDAIDLEQLKQISLIDKAMDLVDHVYRYKLLDGSPSWKGVAADILNEKQLLKLK